MVATLTEWLELLVRWFHVIAGIMWIGSSIFFHWLDKHFVPPAAPREGVEGELWLVHSGGFYQIEKVKPGPGQVPDSLHWFKWEAGFTWLSGVVLLGIVYYLGGGVFLLDPAHPGISGPAAIGIGVGVLVASWLVYDTLWNSPLGTNKPLATGISLALLLGVTYCLCQVFNGRAAFIHVGAVIGTIMVANVFRRIIPFQQTMVDATRAGQRADFSAGERAKARSTHNHYLTYPVVFIMLSSHFPNLYGNALNWVVLALLMAGGATAKYLMTIRERTSAGVPGIIATLVVTVAACYLLVRPTQEAVVAAPAGDVSFGSVKTVIQQRCLTCHSSAPTDDAFKVAPRGIVFDTAAQIKGQAMQINERAVVSQSMPLGNKTGMTPEERSLLGKWIAQGAPLE